MNNVIPQPTGWGDSATGPPAGWVTIPSSNQGQGVGWGTNEGKVESANPRPQGDSNRKSSAQSQSSSKPSSSWGSAQESVEWSLPSTSWNSDRNSRPQTGADFKTPNSNPAPASQTPHVIVPQSKDSQKNQPPIEKDENRSNGPQIIKPAVITNKEGNKDANVILPQIAAPSPDPSLTPTPTTSPDDIVPLFTIVAKP